MGEAFPSPGTVLDLAVGVNTAVNGPRVSTHTSPGRTGNKDKHLGCGWQVRGTPSLPLSLGPPGCRGCRGKVVLTGGWLHRACCPDPSLPSALTPRMGQGRSRPRISVHECRTRLGALPKSHVPCIHTNEMFSTSSCQAQGWLRSDRPPSLLCSREPTHMGRKCRPLVLESVT